MIRYLGGKSAQSATGTGRWIASLLPTGDTYCEPCFGMGGVFLYRAPAKREIINDRSGRIVNFWRVIRDQPEPLATMLDQSPTIPARDEYAWATQR